MRRIERKVGGKGHLTSSRLLSLLRVSICLLLVLPSSLTALECELEWMEASLGSIPDETYNPVEAGPGEYVARVFTDLTDPANSRWQAGKLKPSQKQVTIVTPTDQVLSFQTYQILTNPANCVLHWMALTPKTLPGLVSIEGKVKVSLMAGPEAVFIGRGRVNGYTVGGEIKVLANEPTTLHLSFENKKIQIRDRFEILTSVFPNLSGTLTNFKFDPTDIADLYKKSTLELAGTQIIESTSGSASPNTETITHEKRIVESFDMKEEREWLGLSSLNVSYALWTGTSDVTAIIDFEKTGTVKKGVISIKRDKVFLFSKAIQLTNNKNYRVCNYIQVPATDPVVGEVKFTADAELSAPGMTTEQLTRILEDTGRTLDGVPDVAAGTVSTKMSGTLSGRFAVETGSKELPIGGSCQDLHGKPRL